LAELVQVAEDKPDFQSKFVEAFIPADGIRHKHSTPNDVRIESMVLTRGVKQSASMARPRHSFKLVFMHAE